MKKHRGWKRFLLSFLITVLLVGGWAAGYQIYAYHTRPWYRQHSLIAHAMGGIDGLDYTNSREAFERNYQKGYRVFEVDLRQTSDGVLVGRHDWRKNGRNSYGGKKIPTAGEYLSSRIDGKYTPVSFEDVLLLAKEYPDVYFMTDTKQGNLQKAEETMKLMADTAERLGLTRVLRERFIIQIYNEEMYTAVKQWIDPENILYTVYQLEPEEYAEAAAFCVKRGIPVISIRFKRWNETLQRTLQEAGLVTAVHTINDPAQAKEYFENQVRCLYSDTLDPGDF